MIFNQNRPNILVVDNFYKDPYSLIEHAHTMEFRPDLRYYKGYRSDRHLLPYVKEEFERLLGAQITDWLNQPMNGVFQKTSEADPLVFHADSQSYAAAIYLTEDADEFGTSFWKSVVTGDRRPARDEATNVAIFGNGNILNPKAWELVDKVGGVFNRLVIWDAQMIHSASMYGEKERLVQLFFFNIDQ